MKIDNRFGYNIVFAALICFGLTNAVAQQPKPEPKMTTTTVADNRFGEGGTKETTSDEKFKVYREVWKDKEGQKREIHRLVYFDRGGISSEAWEFIKWDNSSVRLMLFHPAKAGSNYSLSGNGYDDTHSKEDYEAYIAQAEKQFADDRTVPPNPFTKENKNKDVATQVEQPAVPQNEVFTPKRQTSPTEGVEQPTLPEREVFTPAIDSCLIGTWECVSYKENSKQFTGGGTGFRVTFKADGTEIVDYSSMQPIRFAGTDILSFEGKASAKISTNGGVAKIERMLDAGASFHAVMPAFGKDWKPKIPGLGGGGLGEVKGNNTYKCTDDSLEYQVSGARDLHPTGTAKLTRVKTKEEPK
jgi:hypothetical protein